MKSKNENEVIIFQKFAQKGKTLIKFYSGNNRFENLQMTFFSLKYYDLAVAFSNLFISLMVPAIPKIIDVIIPQNQSRSSEILLKVEYLLDADEFFWPLYFHSSFFFYCVFLVFIGIDSYFVMTTQNAISMFVVLG